MKKPSTINPFVIKYKCKLCCRCNFDKPSPHRCNSGFRKRGLVWEKFQVPIRVVLTEKAKPENTYKKIFQTLLSEYSLTSISLRNERKIQ